MYLRNEIFQMARLFEEIVILSCDAKECDSIFTDRLPQNVKHYALNAKRSKLYSILTLFHSKYLKDEQSIKYEKRTNTLIRNSILNYFLNKTEYRLKKICVIPLPLINKEDEMVVYSYRLFDLAMIGIYIKYKYYNNAKLISRAHGYDLYENRNKFKYLPCRMYLMEKLDKIYPCSYDGEKYLREKYREFEDKVSCMYLGTKDYGFKEKNDDNRILKIISCSNVNPVKRVGKIAAVIFEISKRINVEWTHIGDGPELSSIKRKYRVEISKGIMRFVGKQQHDAVIKVYQHNPYDLFINLSESEGIPQAMMEALSFGIPIIATDVGGNAEIVTNNETGFLVDKEADIHTIADIIEDFYRLPRNDVNITRHKCRRSWENYYDAEKNVYKFLQSLTFDNTAGTQL